MTGVIKDVDMSFLDPDITSFQKMLMALSPVRRKFLPAGRLRKGDFVNEDGKQWYVTAIIRKNPDDWFSNEKLAMIERPWEEGRVSKHYWLEDTVFWDAR